MSINITDDIHSITDLKRNTAGILKHVHDTGRPAVLTVNGRAEAVLLDAGTYQKMVSALKLSRLLKPAEHEITDGNTEAAGTFFKRFKRAKKI